MIYYMSLDIVSIPCFFLCRIGNLFYTIPMSTLVSKYISSEHNLETLSNSTAKNIKCIYLYFL